MSSRQFPSRHFLIDGTCHLYRFLQVETVADGNCGMDGPHTAPLWDLKRDLVLLREELQEKNMTIKTLKNELRAASGRTVSKTKDLTTSSKTASCNVATQTDRVCCKVSLSSCFTSNLRVFLK